MNIDFDAALDYLGDQIKRLAIENAIHVATIAAHQQQKESDGDHQGSDVNGAGRLEDGDGFPQVLDQREHLDQGEATDVSRPGDG